MSPADAMNPWVGPPDARPCVRVRLVGDPWSSGAPATPSGGPEVYTVELEAR
jgi:hypothetical protein